MQKIEAYIRHEALEAIRSELYAIGLPSMSVSDVLGSGRQAGIVEHYRGASEVLYLRPKLRLDVVVADEDVEQRDPGHPHPRPQRRDRRRQDLRHPGRGRGSHPHG